MMMTLDPASHPPLLLASRPHPTHCTHTNDTHAHHPTAHAKGQGTFIRGTGRQRGMPLLRPSSSPLQPLLFSAVWCCRASLRPCHHLSPPTEALTSPPPKSHRHNRHTQRQQQEAAAAAVRGACSTTQHRKDGTSSLPRLGLPPYPPAYPHLYRSNNHSASWS
jgi:hypothetical protein